MDPSPATQSPGSAVGAKFLTQLLTIVALLGTVAIVGLMLWFSQRGLDFTDEGYYLASISDPGIYSTSVSQFGFVYHPLFELLGSDIVRARQANILLTFGLALFLADVLLRKVVAADGVSRVQRLAMSSAFATASLLLFAIWLITPSYNSLALQAVMLTIAGVVLVSDAGKTFGAGWWVIGVGGALALLAKPTTALAIAVVVLLSLIGSRAFRLRGVLLSAVVSGAVLVAAALLIDGSIGTFVNRISDDADLIADLDGGHSLGEALRIDSLDPGQRLTLLVMLLVACLTLGAYVVRTASRTRAVAGVAMLVAACAAGVLIARGHTSALLETHPQRALLLVALPLGAIACVAMFRNIRDVSLLRWMLFLTFLVLPHVYAFGSNGDYWQVGGAAAVFWVLAGLVLLPEQRSLPVVLLTFGIVTQVLTAALLAGGARSPYRQPALQEQDVPVQVAGSTVTVGAGFAQYIREVSTATANAGFRPGTPVIDLTGRSPTLLYVIGAKGIGQPWIIGAYPGSAKVALAALELAGCRDVSEAWILTEPAGPRRVAGSVLTGLGISLEGDYEIAGTWDTASGVAGSKKPVAQELWKPVRSAAGAADACRDATRR